MTPLYAEANRWLSTPFVWGEHDCVLSLADWIMRVHGVDLAAEWRMTYSSVGECQRVTKFFTDAVGFMERAIAPLGLERTDAPQAGDIALCMVPGQAHPVGGLCLNQKLWAFKAPEGATSMHARLVNVIAAWSVGYAG